MIYKKKELCPADDEFVNKLILKFKSYVSEE